MPTTIESLELEVQSSSTTAVSGIDALSVSLSKLKNAVKGGVGLTSVTNQLKGLNAALLGIDGSSAGKLDTLSNSLSKLSGLGNIKISSSIANQLKNIGSATTSLNGVDFSGVGRLSTALQSLTSLGKSNLASFITQLGKLPQLAQTFQDMNMAQFASHIQQLSNALTPLTGQLNTVSTAFSRLPTNIRNTASATNKIVPANDAAAKSYVNLWAKVSMAKTAIMGISRVIASWITESNSYIENLNLFTVSMGKYASEAQRYAEQVGEVMGIDPGQWMRNQGVFMTITKGFGVAGDKAYIMSKNLTQLGYDLTSFYNLEGGVADGMQKLQSGIAGELEPLRRLGYDLSVARLQQEAYALGIDKSVQSMTQAEKAQLRYYTIMRQVTWAQGDMARTLNAPANQLRVLTAQIKQCARALGNIFIPILTTVLPYLIAFAKVLRMVINIIGKLFNFELPEVDFSGITAGSDAMGDLTDSENDAAKAAKKLRNALAGFDELNILPSNDYGGADFDNGLVGGGDLGIELPDNKGWLDGAINTKVDELVNKFKEWLGITDDIDTWAEFFETRLGKILIAVGAIGAVFATWKIAQGLTKALSFFETLKGKNLSYNIGFTIAGLGGLMDAWDTIKEAIEDIMKNGPNFTNVTKLISGFAEGLGMALIILGNVKVGGATLVIAGIAGIASDIADICKNGFNWENSMSLIKNIGLLLAGVGFYFGNLKLGGIGLIIMGATLIIENIQGLIKGITTGDWGDVEKGEVIAGALLIIGGLVVALKKVASVKDVASMGKAKETIDTVKTVTEGVSTSVGQLSPKLTSLAKNLGMGLVIIAEVAVAALLITGAIILLGMGLEQVGIAWQPVIDNGETIAISMGIGVAFLAGIGVVTALLGTVGTPLIVNMALGTAILALLGVSAGLFIIEIWAIGKGLEQIGIAWQPVIDNGEMIAIAIGLGTGLLLAIGVATAALGLATTASAGTLPLAIAIGTAVLLEMGVAVGLFVIEIWAIGKGLEQVGIAWQPVIDNGETIAIAVGLGTALLVAIGVATAALGIATVASAGTLPLAIGLGTAILLEMGIAVGLFVVEIVAIGKGLDEVGQAWQPVLDNGETIKQGIGIGTGLLVAIGVVTAALGIAAVASVGLLPLAIDAGTGLLVKLGESFILFTESMVAVSDELGNNLAPSLTRLNTKLPALSTNMENFVGFMTDFAGHVVEYTKVSAVAGLSATIDTIVGWFTQDPIDKLAKDVKKIYDQTFKLNEQLRVAVPELKVASTLLKQYQTFCTEIETLTNSNISLSDGMFVNMKEVGQKLVTGFVEGIQSKSADFSNAGTELVDGFKESISTGFESCEPIMTAWADNIETWFTVTASYDTFYGIAEDVVSGFNNGIGSLYNNSRSSISGWASSIVRWFKSELDIHSPSKVFAQMADFTIEGYNNEIAVQGKDTKGIMSSWVDSFTDISPKLALAVDTSAIESYSDLI